MKPTFYSAVHSISFHLQIPLLNFLSLPGPSILLCCLPASVPQECRPFSVSVRFWRIISSALSWQIQSPSDPSLPINHGEPLAKARLAPECLRPPALQKHFSASLSPNRSPCQLSSGQPVLLKPLRVCGAESAGRRDKERKQTGQKTHSRHV